MPTTDPIADMLTRLRNASAAHHTQTRMPHSRVKAALAELLVREGFVSKAGRDENEGKPELVVSLRYGDDRTPALQGIARVSKPGQRIYVPKQKVPRVRQGLGVAVLSTPKGLMTDREARRAGVGGEVICTVW
ncbi:MAG: 30S ribosomal protein S8 [Candidatus Andersenbacteria bacterium]